MVRAKGINLPKKRKRAVVEVEEQRTSSAEADCEAEQCAPASPQPLPLLPPPPAMSLEEKAEPDAKRALKQARRDLALFEKQFRLDVKMCDKHNEMFEHFIEVNRPYLEKGLEKGWKSECKLMKKGSELAEKLAMTGAYVEGAKQLMHDAQLLCSALELARLRKAVSGPGRKQSGRK